MDNNADLSLENDRGENAFDLAYQNSNDEIGEYLEEKFNQLKKNPDMDTTE